MNQSANVNVTNKLGLTPLHYAASKNRDNAIEILMAKGADVNLMDIGGRLPLHIAAESGKCEQLQFFVNFNTISSLEFSRADNMRMVELLLNKTVDVNAKDNSGQSALDFASFVGHEDIMEALIKAGANVNIRNNYSNTPLLIASGFGKTFSLKEHFKV